jgi:hypothetical protein
LVVGREGRGRLGRGMEKNPSVLASSDTSPKQGRSTLDLVVSGGDRKKERGRGDFLFFGKEFFKYKIKELNNE